MGERMETNPIISAMFAMELPTMVPSMISFVPFIDEIKPTTASGALVPKATMEMPIINGEIPKDFAIFEEESIKKSDPFIKITNPINNMKKSIQHHYSVFL